MCDRSEGLNQSCIFNTLTFDEICERVKEKLVKFEKDDERMNVIISDKMIRTVASGVMDRVKDEIEYDVYTLIDQIADDVRQLIISVRQRECWV